MQKQVTIPSRFNGPPASGNGGYSCGVLAAFIDGPARVRLHVPPPLDTPLDVQLDSAGAVEMYDGDVLVGSGAPLQFDLDVPASPGLAAAQEAMTRYASREEHIFPTCFVCGPGRPRHDGLELFPGPVNDWNLLACVWRPAEDLLDAQGRVLPEIMWAALDCPGYFAAMGEAPRPAVLGQLEGALYSRDCDGESLVVYAWPLGGEGRKYYAGTAVANAAGEVLASARSTWIELRDH